MIFSRRECTNSGNILFQVMAGSRIPLNCNVVSQICHFRFLVASVADRCESLCFIHYLFHMYLAK